MKRDSFLGCYPMVKASAMQGLFLCSFSPSHGLYAWAIVVVPHVGEPVGVWVVFRLVEVHGMAIELGATLAAWQHA